MFLRLNMGIISSINMTEKTFNIYCDESTHLEHDGYPYMLYGYVSIASD